MSLNKLVKKLKSKDNYIILGHVDPDADCIGSMATMQFILEKINKKSIIFLEKKPKDNLSFLLEDKNINYNRVNTNKLNWPEYNIICLDSGDKERLGKYGEQLVNNYYTINIDHHVDNKKFGDFNYVNSKKAAVGQIVYNITEELGITVDKASGMAIAAAIISDTGSFRYENTSAEVLNITSDLINKGIDLYKVNQYLFGQKSFNSTKLKGLALSTLEISKCGKIAWLKVDKKMLQQTESKPEMSSGLVNYARDIKGVEVGICFTYIQKNSTKVSFRSNNYCPVHEIAAKFTGGGHPRAAGCTINKPLKHSMKNVLNEVKKFV